MPKLIIQFQGQEWSVELKEGTNVIGRSSSCTIPVRDSNLSREHCEIRLAGGEARLLDRGSMNGTLVNGSKVLEQKLAPGDRIQAGSTTIYFEEKGAAPAPAAPPSPSAPAKEERARSAPTVAKAYSLWGRDRRWGGALLLAGILAAAIGVVVFITVRQRAADEGEEEDPDNVLAGIGNCETAEGWSLRPGLASRIAIDPSVAHRGKASLAIEKSGNVSEMVVDCLSAQEFAVGETGRVELSAWSKAEGFGGFVALKVVWTTGVRGAILLEEYSEPQVATGWVRLSKTFTAPPGAGAYQIGLSGIGRAGRIYFDDVRLVARRGAKTPETVIGEFSVAAGPSGAFQVSVDRRRILSNVHLAMVGEQDGTLPQTIVTRAEAKADQERVEIQGKMLSPVGLREVEFQEHLIRDGNDLVIAYTLAAADVKQIDRLLVVATVPRPERITGLPAPGEPGTMRVIARAEETDLVLEYLEPTPVTSSRERGGQKLVQAFPIDPSAARVTVGFKIRAGVGGLPAAQDPLKAAEVEKTERENFSGALAILRRQVGVLRDPELRQKIAAEIEWLEDTERDDWNEVLAAGFRAATSRRAEMFDVALQRVGAYQRKWGGEPYAAKSQPLREEIEKDAAQAWEERDRERSTRLLTRAKAYRDSGRRALATAVCEVLVSRFADTAAADEAAEILKSMEGP